MRKTCLLLVLAAFASIACGEGSASKNKSCKINADCKDGLICVDGKCREEANECEDNDVSCEEDWTRICQSGVWVRIKDCSTDGKICEAGACVDSSDGDEEDSEAADESEIAEPDPSEDNNEEEEYADSIEEVESTDVEEAAEIDEEIFIDEDDNEVEENVSDGDEESVDDEANEEQAVEDEIEEETDDLAEIDEPFEEDAAEDEDLMEDDSEESVVEEDAANDDETGDETLDEEAIDDETGEISDDPADMIMEDEIADEITDDAEGGDETLETGTECEDGPCCDNGYWVAAGGACVSGQDDFVCTADACDENHECSLHTLIEDFCLIDSVCYESKEGKLDFQCVWCDTATPAEWTNKPETESCDDGNPGTYNDKCSDGKCVGSSCECGANDACCDGCHAINGGGACNKDDNGCTLDKCQAGSCVVGGAPDCSEQNDQCNVGTCLSTGANGYACVKSPANEGNSCNKDDNGCTLDYCSSGSCSVGPAPSCFMQDDDCNIGTCMSAGSNNYTCFKKPANDGGSCNKDNDGCTLDKCQSGACLVGAAPDCSSQNDFCNVGTCRSDSYTAYACIKSPVNEGGLCDKDGNGCTLDSCKAGACIQGLAADCSASADQCNSAGCSSTSPTTYQCSKTPINEGNSCNKDDNGCTLDKCQAGLCVIGSAPNCSAQSDQCNEGACFSTGSSSYACVKSPSNEGNSCNKDDNGCTLDKCLAGSCVIGSAPDCSAQNDQCHAGTCSSSGNHSYSCVKTNANEGESCDDGDSGTVGDICLSGVCAGYPPVCEEGPCCKTGKWVDEGQPCVSGQDAYSCTADTCDASHACVHTIMQDKCLIFSTCLSAGQGWDPDGCMFCDPDNSQTEWTNAPPTKTCDASTGDPCKVGHCSAGYCAYYPSQPSKNYPCEEKPCMDAHCEVSGGLAVCSWTQSEDGTSCLADSDGCTVDKCLSGKCEAGGPPDCDDYCNTGTCVSTGANSHTCSKTPANENGLCDADGYGCSIDRCYNGSCVQGPIPDCSSVNDQCNIGSCFTTGAMSYECRKVSAYDGTVCYYDDDGCTVEKCNSGACEVASNIDCSSEDDDCNYGSCRSANKWAYICDKTPTNEDDWCVDPNLCIAGSKCHGGTCEGGIPYYTCNDHGTCMGAGACECLPNYTGEHCDQCAAGYSSYPYCVKECKEIVAQTTCESTVSLYSQLSQPLFSGFDAFSADEFIIEGTEGLTITALSISGHYYQNEHGLLQAGKINIEIYPDDGNGKPAGYPHYSSVTPYWALSVTPNDAQVTLWYSTTLDLSKPDSFLIFPNTPPTFAPGKYWMFAYVEQDYAENGAWYWVTNPNPFNDTAKWINPEGGFRYGYEFMDITTVLPNIYSLAFWMYAGSNCKETIEPFFTSTPDSGKISVPAKVNTPKMQSEKVIKPFDETYSLGK